MGKISIGSTIIYDSEAGGGGTASAGAELLAASIVDAHHIVARFNKPLVGRISRAGLTAKGDSVALSILAASSYLLEPLNDSFEEGTHFNVEKLLNGLELMQGKQYFTDRTIVSLWNQPLYGWNDEYRVTQTYSNANAGTYQSGNFYGTYRIPVYGGSGKLAPPSGLNLFDVTSYMPTDGTYLCFYFYGGGYTSSQTISGLYLYFEDGWYGTIQQAADLGYINPIVLFLSYSSSSSYVYDLSTICTGGSSASRSYANFRIFIKPIANMVTFRFTLARAFSTSGSDGFYVYNTRVSRIGPEDSQYTKALIGTWTLPPIDLEELPDSRGVFLKWREYENTQSTLEVQSAVVTEEDIYIQDENIDLSEGTLSSLIEAPNGLTLDGGSASTATNVAFGGTVTSNATWNDRGYSIVDNVTTYNYYCEAGGLNIYAQVDFGAVYKVNKAQIWHYYQDGRTYYGTKVELSEDGLVWYTVFDSAVSGTYVETSGGKIHTFPTMKARYIRDYLSGSTANTGNHWIEIKVFQASPNYPTSGTAISDPIALENLGEYVSSEVSFSIETPTNTTLLVKSAFTTDLTEPADLDFTTIVGGEILNAPSSLDGKYLWIKAYFESTDSTETPLLKGTIDVSIEGDTSIGIHIPDPEEYGEIWVLDLDDASAGTFDIAGSTLDYSATYWQILNVLEEAYGQNCVEITLYNPFIITFHPLVGVSSLSADFTNLTATSPSLTKTQDYLNIDWFEEDNYTAVTTIPSERTKKHLVIRAVLRTSSITESTILNKFIAEIDTRDSLLLETSQDISTLTTDIEVSYDGSGILKTEWPAIESDVIQVLT